MKAVGKLSNKEQVLWALKEYTTTDPKSGLSVREAIEKAGVKFVTSSHSNAMAYIWKTFGTDKGGMGFFDRVKRGAGYAYYKATPKVDDYTLEELKKPHAPKKEKTQEPATDAAPDVATAATSAPGTLNVNLKVTWDINLNFNGLKDLFK